MELRHLRYFVAIAQAGHFTQAAEALYIAQPALSQQIQALERELGVTLFERTSRHVRLTPAGEAFLAHAQRILAAVEQAQDEMHAFAGLVRGRVTVGVLQSLSAYRLPALLARFHARYPGIEMVLREDVTEPLLAQLKDGQIDMALTHTIAGIFPLNVTDPQIVAETILTEEVVLIVSPQHRFAGLSSISPAMLRDEVFLFFKPGSGLRQWLIHASEMGEFTPRVLFESGDIATIRALVSEGLGVSAFPRSVVDTAGKEIATVRLDPSPPPRTVAMVWHTRIKHSLAAATFLAFLRDDLQAFPWNHLNT